MLPERVLLPLLSGANGGTGSQLVISWPSSGFLSMLVAGITVFVVTDVLMLPGSVA